MTKKWVATTTTTTTTTGKNKNKNKGGGGEASSSTISAIEEKVFEAEAIASKMKRGKGNVTSSSSSSTYRRREKKKSNSANNNSSSSSRKEAEYDDLYEFVAVRDDTETTPSNSNSNSNNKMTRRSSSRGRSRSRSDNNNNKNNITYYTPEAYENIITTTGRSRSYSNGSGKELSLTPTTNVAKAAAAKASTAAAVENNNGRVITSVGSTTSSSSRRALSLTRPLQDQNQQQNQQQSRRRSKSPASLLFRRNRRGRSKSPAPPHTQSLPSLSSSMVSAPPMITLQQDSQPSSDRVLLEDDHHKNDQKNKNDKNNNNDANDDDEDDDERSSDFDEANIEVVYYKFGNKASTLLNVMQYDYIPRPVLPTDVVIRVEASTVTLKDVMIRRGLWYEEVSLPNTPGFDVVGKVHNIGEHVQQTSQFAIGDRVAALIRTGGNARYAIVPVHQLVSVPIGVDAAEAASVTSTFMTAFQALHAARRAESKESLRDATVLITGGNGPVGQALIQLALRAGARIVYATALAKHHSRIQSLGAVALPFDPQDWLPTVKGQMDVVVDSICLDSYASPQAALNHHGRLVVTGMTSIVFSSKYSSIGRSASAFWATTKAKYFMSRTVSYEVWNSMHEDPAGFKHDLDYLFTLLARGEIKVPIAERITLPEVAMAHIKIERGDAFGQMVCLPWKKFLYRKKKRKNSNNNNKRRGGDGASSPSDSRTKQSSSSSSSANNNNNRNNDNDGGNHVMRGGPTALSPLRVRDIPTQSDIEDLNSLTVNSSVGTDDDKSSGRVLFCG